MARAGAESQVMVPLDLTTAEFAQLLIGIAGLSLIFYGIRVMRAGNTERSAIARTLDAHTETLTIQTQALRKLLEEKS